MIPCSFHIQATYRPTGHRSLTSGNSLLRWCKSVDCLCCAVSKTNLLVLPSPRTLVQNLSCVLSLVPIIQPYALLNPHVDKINHHSRFLAGMLAGVLHPHAYQALIDRGWRRSGRYLYKVRTRCSSGQFWLFQAHSAKARQILQLCLQHKEFRLQQCLPFFLRWY